MSILSISNEQGSTLTVTRQRPTFTVCIELQTHDGHLCEFKAGIEHMRALAAHLTKAVSLADKLKNDVVGINPAA